MHLTKNHGCLIDNSGLRHLIVEIITFPSSFTNTSKNRISSMFSCNISNELLNKNGFSNTGSSKKTCFSTSSVWLHQINNFNTGDQYFSRCCQVIMTWSRSMNRVSFICFTIPFLINSIS